MSYTLGHSGGGGSGGGGGAGGAPGGIHHRDALAGTSGAKRAAIREYIHERRHSLDGGDSSPRAALLPSGGSFRRRAPRSSEGGGGQSPRRGSGGGGGGGGGALLSPAADLAGSWTMLKSSWLNVLIVAAPLGLVAEHLGWGASAVFLLVRLRCLECDVQCIAVRAMLAAVRCVCCAGRLPIFNIQQTTQNGKQNLAALIPLALLLGFVTEDLSLRLGEVLGGLINATFGNVRCPPPFGGRRARDAHLAGRASCARGGDGGRGLAQGTGGASSGLGRRLKTVPPPPPRSPTSLTLSLCPKQVVEIIISIAALLKGLYQVVATSLLGSILSNMLFVLGMSFVAGGVK